MTDASADMHAVSNLLSKFFRCFDDKNWLLMRTCLCDTIYTDYSSFRDVPAGHISGDRYVEQRRLALKDLDMQHNYLNLHTEVSGDRAKSRCNYLIHRFHPQLAGSPDQFFHSYGHYWFEFERLGASWLISSITQNLLKNWGNPEIHGATRAVDNTRHA